MEVGDAPSRRAVSDEGIRKQDNRSHMLNGDLSSPVGIEEASIRCRRSEDGDRSFTVAAIECLH